MHTLCRDDVMLMVFPVCGVCKEDRRGRRGGLQTQRRRPDGTRAGASSTADTVLALPHLDTVAIISHSLC